MVSSETSGLKTWDIKQAIIKPMLIPGLSAGILYSIAAACKKNRVSETCTADLKWCGNL